MSEKTLAYSDNFDGWPLFYSFEPDFMIGMNGSFYSFKGGNLFLHNDNSARSTFYGQAYNSQLIGVFNESPMENKVFKTISIEGGYGWDFVLDTDIGANGTISDSDFELKEGSLFSYIKTESDVPMVDSNMALRSVVGIGIVDTVDGIAPTKSFHFPLNTYRMFSGSVGDLMYCSSAPYSSMVFVGTITDKLEELPNGGIIKINTNHPDAQPIPAGKPLCLYVKNASAESSGLIGKYCKFTMTTDSAQKRDIFSVSSEVMKSFP